MNEVFKVLSGVGFGLLVGYCLAAWKFRGECEQLKLEARLAHEALVRLVYPPQAPQILDELSGEEIAQLPVDDHQQQGW
jgi:hypothetical protein